MIFKLSGKEGEFFTHIQVCNKYVCVCVCVTWLSTERLWHRSKPWFYQQEQLPGPSTGLTSPQEEPKFKKNFNKSTAKQ